MANKIAIITGASSGIGERLTIDLVQQGNAVIMLARRKEVMEATIKRENFSEKQAIAISCDVSDYEKFDAAVKEGLEHFRKVFNEDLVLDLFVNNSGVMPLGPVSEMSVEDYTTMVNVNVLGVMHGLRIASKLMIPNKTGTIVNVSSIAGRKPFPNHAFYNATKYGVHGMTEGARHELRTNNIRVIIVAPGAVQTNLLKESNTDDTVNGYKSWLQQCGGEMLRSEDVSSAILYAYNAPQRVTIREIVMAGITQDDV
uniref:Oxidoreductase n=1 Tax=Percolomonas cosmopolitus TaxID=63605 RepID=A0A7S1PG16_9EUKA|eukprot:CAMPEP_0117444766 /NCGR_PEP_ID=MMETSP0759-20121206/5426_1 /TAXON_ID=63605 /ORGANISM="Percolomonas cosmopolitus, Strain WS" /LENGTH=255 /DNA_ID=CAMNT_0005236875 /DNA_START=838 /DNA_END=1605 /DNA_ORIENTATION=-